MPTQLIDSFWRSLLWQQFGAAIDTLDQNMIACPAELWEARIWREQDAPSEYSQYWYVAFHTLFWLDLYLTGTAEGFMPPEPFTLDELDPAGVLPERTYTKEELRTYLAYSRSKCHATIDALTEEQARRLCRFGGGEGSFAELLLYSMRHVQEHSAQLQLFLGQQLGKASGWVSRAKSSE